MFKFIIAILIIFNIGLTQDMDLTGKIAPDFTLKDETGKSFTLSEFKGQDVVVYFYPKDDTPG